MHHRSPTTIARHAAAALALATAAPAAVTLCGRPAAAQVTMNNNALEQLTPTPAKPAPARPARPAARPATGGRATAETTTLPSGSAARAHAASQGTTTAEGGTAKPAPGSKQATAQPTPSQPIPPIPAGPPSAAVIPPPVAVPNSPPPPPPPVTVSTDAPGTASDIPGGIRITFGDGRTDLNPSTQAAVESLAAAARSQGGVPINVIAHAPGVPDDPSTPRRLALTRGLTARAVLIHAGIPSTRIYVRALGPTDVGDAPANRVDIILGNQTAQAAPASPAPATPETATPPVATQ